MSNRNLIVSLVWLAFAIADLGLHATYANERGWLGVSVSESVDPASGISNGVVVIGVAPNSPAMSAGLQPQDRILAVDNLPVIGPQQFVNMIGGYRPGSKLTLQIYRTDRTRQIGIIIGQYSAQIPSKSGNRQTTTNPYQAPGPTAGNANTEGTLVTVKETQHCSLYVPVNWRIWGNPQASTLEAMSPDSSAYAGWGILPINQAMEPFYGDLYGPPEKSIAYLVKQSLASYYGDTSVMKYTNDPSLFLDYFTLRQFQSARYTGWVFYKNYPTNDPQTRIQSAYLAIAPNGSPQALKTAAGVAISIRCQTQFQPRPPVSPGGGGQSRKGCGTGGNLRGYQKELGSQYAHSPTTGENFLMDAATQWRDGPQGPGYYRAIGSGDYEKLDLGRSDDC